MEDEHPGNSKGAAATSVDSTASFNQWELEQLPEYPPVAGLNLPRSVESDRVSIHVKLDGGMAIEDVRSFSHPMKPLSIKESEWEAELASGRTVDNCDFVLVYRLGGEKTTAGVLAHMDERGGFFSLLIEPPAIPSQETITPREMVFVLDCSGSMKGWPMETSKAFMRKALLNLRSKDMFRIVTFSHSASEFSSRPLEANELNIQHGLHFVNRLRAGGGTEMKTGISQALDPVLPEGVLRLVVFLTDGYIGNEHEILSLLNRKIDRARLFSVGVGASVNRYLLSRMAELGRGFERIITDRDDPHRAAQELEKRLNAPVLTDIVMDWGDLNPSQVAPSRIPDLFAGHSLRILGRFDKPGDYEIAVVGRSNGGKARLPLKINVPEASLDGEAIALTWARAAIAENMKKLAKAQFQQRNDELTTIKEDIVRLGLSFNLVTQWTAFLAVTEKQINPHPQGTRETSVPLPMVKNVTAAAYPSAPAITGMNSNGSPAAFSGNSTPEPASILGLGTAALAGLAALRRRRRWRAL
jgi:Ca-activated chloride channel family protein